MDEVTPQVHNSVYGRIEIVKSVREQRVKFEF